MPYYESVFIIRPEAPPAYRERVARELTELVGQMGGKVKKHEYWGLRNLAYPIRKYVQGHYFMLQLEAPAGAVSELNRTMRLTEEIMRYQTLRIKRLDPEPSPIMQTKYEYGEHKDRSSTPGRAGGSERHSERSMGHESGRSSVSRNGADRDGRRPDRSGSGSTSRYREQSS